VKRLTILAAAGLAGSLFVIPTMAASAALPATVSTVAPASDALPAATVVAAVRTAPPLVKVTVVSGDTLSGIAASHPPSTWPGIAAYNHIANPNLIFPGQVFTIPPAGYVGTAVFPRIPAVSAPVVRYTAPVPVHHYVAPAPVSYSAPGSYQACVAMRESGNGSGSSNIYGFLQGTWSSLGLSGSPGSASRATQDTAFQMLYARDGRAPWSPYDGC
jgi:LysM repeat protein